MAIIWNTTIPYKDYTVDNFDIEDYLDCINKAYNGGIYTGFGSFKVDSMLNIKKINTVVNNYEKGYFHCKCYGGNPLDKYMGKK